MTLSSESNPTAPAAPASAASAAPAAPTPASQAPVTPVPPAPSDLPASDLDLLRRFRRDLHRIPELDFDLPRTIAYVEGVLSGLSCEVTRPCPSCVCAFFDRRGSDAPAGDPAQGSATAIRADMDALPITEATGAPFASTCPGHMHACGHDTHMAMALTAAVWVDRQLREHPGGLPRNVLFVFQPAEETTGGAKTVCDSGVFERYRVDRIFGFHVWPDLPAGTVASRPGPLLARSSETHITIHGASTHIAKTYGVDDAHSRDAMLAAARFVVRERELMARLGEDEPCICKFGQLEAGTVCNAVAGEARIAGSLRVFSEEMFARAKAEISRLLETCCAETGCTGEVHFAEGYPPVRNDERLYGLAAAALDGEDGAPALARVPEPLLIAEDFAFYQQHLPGVFFLLGVGEPATGEGAPVPSGRAMPADVRRRAASALGSDERDVQPYATSALHTATLMFREELLLPGVATYRRLLQTA